MKPLDVMKGTGTVLVNKDPVMVQYNLEVYEREILGWIRPHCGEQGEALWLKMQDGSSVRFLFKDTQGSVTATNN